MNKEYCSNRFLAATCLEFLVRLIKNKGLFLDQEGCCYDDG